jgi:MFS family permease
VVAAGALAQWPIGRMSDQVDRRVLLAMLLGGSIAAGLALGLLPATPTSLLVLGFAFGTLALPGYSLVAAHAYDKMPAGEAVETAAGVLLAYGAGSILGPALASLTMAGVGPGGLFLFTAAAQGLLLAFVMHRARVQPPLPASAKTGFDLAATAPMGAVITTEPLDVTDPLVAVPDTAPAPQPDADPAPRQQDEPTR